MKSVILVMLLAICAIESRKILPLNKNANIDFINMESGGGARPNPAGPFQPAPGPAKPQNSEPPKTVTPPSQPPTPPKSPVSVTTKPVPVVVTTKPVPVTVTSAPSVPVKPAQPKPIQPSPLPTQSDLDWKPLPSKPASGTSTPGYGSVKQLVTFHDSQGKASVIRPHSYSQAVKQG